MGGGPASIDSRLHSGDAAPPTTRAMLRAQPVVRQGLSDASAVRPRYRPRDELRTCSGQHTATGARLNIGARLLKHRAALSGQVWSQDEDTSTELGRSLEQRDGDHSEASTL